MGTDPETSVVDPDNVERLYAVTGELFFASTNGLVHAFDYDAVKVGRVEIDLTDASVWERAAPHDWLDVLRAEARAGGGLAFVSGHAEVRAQVKQQVERREIGPMQIVDE